MESLLILSRFIKQNNSFTFLKGQVPNAKMDPVLGIAGKLTETKQGARKLHLRKLAKGLGVPLSVTTRCSKRLLDRRTSMYHREYLSLSIVNLGRNSVEESRIIKQRQQRTNTQYFQLRKDTCLF